MNVIKCLLGTVLILALSGCDNSSGDSKEAPVTPEVTPTYETTKVKFRFNLPSSSPVMDTSEFSYDDRGSYGGSVTALICDPMGEQIYLTTYFIKVDENRWDLYFKLKNNGLNIVDGEVGGLGQYKASLEFDNEGNFIRQYPYLISSFDIEYEDLVQTVEFDFYSTPSTSLDFPLNVSLLDVNGCK
ncbi:hypothetical protein FM038_015460 [Shewanella eurypsychrophilus]|uniref:Flagellar hook protein FlgE D2 domain-containing protein n=1 Tax=Shewanella eurypsychrophilus TaxID=2593656 RepID=A0ABX6V811_9GAMM|nr:MULTISPECIES: flagellar basal body FlgE domain-containing protein [Shewanella]QFU23428.1 hypothetical protein FS418_17275 [Shewanella sp. YLB-09]QPG58656.1 hypothetical protein FM038_015460 [Shewanella eurypsychrophilus]